MYIPARLRPKEALETVKTAIEGYDETGLRAELDKTDDINLQTLLKAELKRRRKYDRPR